MSVKETHSFPILQGFHFRFCNHLFKSNIYGGGFIGRVTDGDILAGGAALLLLLRS
jgi:hypothetical protein